MTPWRRSLHSLPVFVRLQGVNVIVLGTGDAADAKRRLLDRAGAVIVGEGATAALAIVAIDDDDLAESAVKRLKSRGILVNAVDRVALCDFTLPAIIDRDPVLIAIGTGGASAGLAKALRQRLELLLPQSLGSLATALQNARSALRTKIPDPAARRKAIDAALSEGGPLDPFADNRDVALWLATSVTKSPDRIETIILNSADADDLTLRQARMLGGADHIYYGPDVPTAILSRGRADAARIQGEPPTMLPPGVTVIVQMA